MFKYPSVSEDQKGKDKAPEDEEAEKAEKVTSTDETKKEKRARLNRESYHRYYWKKVNTPGGREEINAKEREKKRNKRAELNSTPEGKAIQSQKDRDHYQNRKLKKQKQKDKDSGHE